MLAEIPQCQRQGHLFIAIFNLVAQKELEKGILSLNIASHQKYQRSTETKREREEKPCSGSVFLCVTVCEKPKCGSGQPPIMSASKTSPLMATICLQGGLLHTTVLQKQRQIYKTTIRKRGKNQSKCH